MKIKITILAEIVKTVEIFDELANEFKNEVVNNNNLLLEMKPMLEKKFKEDFEMECKIKSIKVENDLWTEEWKEETNGKSN